jgi:hypothetical protein
MRFRFASWNVNAFTGLAGHIALIERVGCDLLALQEVTQASYNTLAASQIFSWSAFSLALRPPQAGEGRGRRLGCALFGRAPFAPGSFALLDGVQLPERTLLALLETPFGPLTACSFHAPPGVNWGEVKPKTFVRIAQWLAMQPQRVIFGMDANTPKLDHPDSSKVEWWWQDEAVLLGAAPAHQLRDVLRTYLAARPDEMQQLRAARPQGPLAMSYVRGQQQGKPTPCRYDVICAAPDFQVEQVAYLYEEAVQAGSDHALVVATLQYNE